jgi:glycosyltransferase involved in cell wall biosynthesis
LLLSIIIPCYNEQDSIGELLSRLEGIHLPLDKEVIVIDDGSSDGSADVVKRYSSVKLIRHERNLGKGAAVKTGIEHSTGDLILIQDADMEYFPEDIPSLVSPILQDEADFVLGSRIRGTHQGMSLSHLVGNLLLSLAATVLLAKPITDLMTGYKVFKRKVLEGFAISSTAFEVDAELVANAVEEGYRLREVPIRYQYRRTGVSKIGWKHAVGTLAQLFRIRTHVVLLFFLFVLGFGLRYAGVNYATTNSLELVADAQGYIMLATSITHLSYPLAREPGFPLVEAFSFLIFGSGVGVFRMTTAILGSLVILASYKLGESLHSRASGLMVAAMVAIDPFLVWNSTRGLREELFSLILILLVYHTITATRHQFKSKMGVIDALLAVGLTLTKLEGAAIAVGVCVFALWYANLKAWRKPIVYISTILLSTLAALAGWALFSWIQFGDPAATMTAQGALWYAYEFGAPKSVTALEYLVGYHTPFQLASMWVLGMLRIMNNLFSLYLGILGFALGIIGLFYLVRLPHTITVHIALLASIAPVAFFFGVAYGADYRLLYPLFPLFYCLVAVAVAVLTKLTQNWDRMLANYGLSFSVPVTKRMRINLRPSHFCYVLLLCVICHEIWMSTMLSFAFQQQGPILIGQVFPDSIYAIYAFIGDLVGLTVVMVWFAFLLVAGRALVLRSQCERNVAR